MRERSVLFVLPPGGSLADLERVGQRTRFLSHYVGSYAARGWRVGLLSCGALDEESRLAGEAPLVALIAPRRSRRWLWCLWAPLRHARRLREFAVCRATQARSTPTILLARVTAGTRAVTTFGYDYEEDARRSGGRAKAVLLRSLLRLTLPSCDLVLVTSEATAASARELGVDPTRMRSLPNAAPVSAMPVRERDAGTVLWVGRLAPQKRLDRALEIAARARLHLMVVGSGPIVERDQLRLAQVGEHLGAVPHDQVLELLDHCSIYLLTSEWEGVPKSLVEALARGTPSVVPDLPELAWLTRRTGEPLVATYPPGDVDEAVAVVEELVRDDARRAQLGAAAHRFARRNLDLRPTIEREIEFLEEVVRPRCRIVFAPKGTPRVASSRYRVHLPARCLAEEGHRVGVLVPPRPSTAVSARVLDAGRDLSTLVRVRPEVAVFQRPGRRREHLWYAQVLRAFGARIVVDLDDPIDTTSPVTSGVLGLAHEIMVGHESLLSTLAVRERRRSRARVTPVPVDLYADPTHRSDHPEVPIVGWIGDGCSQADLVHHLVGDVLHSPHLEERRFGLRLVGVEPRELRLVPEVAAFEERVECITDVRWDDEQAVAAECARFIVGLAPYRGQPGVAFKVIQYLAAGVVPLVDRQSPGVDHLSALPEWLRSMCVTDFSNSASWCHSLAGLLDLVGQADARKQVQGTLVEAARAFDVRAFARSMVER